MLLVITMKSLVKALILSRTWHKKIS